MSKLEKRLILFAIIFVIIYLGAIVATIQSRSHPSKAIPRLESVAVTEEEGRLLMVELLLPMAVLFTLSVCFLVAKKRREKTYQKLDEPDDAE